MSSLICPKCSSTIDVSDNSIMGGSNCPECGERVTYIRREDEIFEVIVNEH